MSQKEGKKLSLGLIWRDNDNIGTVGEQLGNEIIAFRKYNKVSLEKVQVQIAQVSLYVYAAHEWLTWVC